MKKILTVFLCFLLCVSFSGCTGTKIDGAKARRSLESVLNQEQTFTYKTLVFDKIKQENLNNFKFQTPYSAHEVFIPQLYSYIDFDRDGVEELLVVDMSLSYFLILRYDGEKVVGYLMDKNIDLQNIKTDGTFLMISYVYDNDYKIVDKSYYVCEVELNNLDYKINELASQDNGNSTYKIGEKNVTKAEVEAHINNWKNNTTQIKWVTIK